MLSDIRIILVRPAHSGNIGATARAIKNMGLGVLSTVQLQGFDRREAERMAHGAEDILAAARHSASLAEAVHDCRWIVGTTRRTGKRRGAVFAPRSLAEAVHSQKNRRPLALVFGPEKDGLSSAELALCQDILCIPTSAAHPSLNLAQAVLIVAYELFSADSAAQSQTQQSQNSSLATSEEMEGLYTHLEEVLFEIGFVRRETAPHQMLALRRLLGRTSMRPQEIIQLRGICRQVLWAVRHKPR